MLSTRETVDRLSVSFGFDAIFAGMDHGLDTGIGEMGIKCSCNCSYKDCHDYLPAVLTEGEHIPDEPD